MTLLRPVLAVLLLGAAVMPAAAVDPTPQEQAAARFWTDFARAPEQLDSATLFPAFRSLPADVQPLVQTQITAHIVRMVQARTNADPARATELKGLISAGGGENVRSLFWDAARVQLVFDRVISSHTARQAAHPGETLTAFVTGLSAEDAARIMLGDVVNPGTPDGTLPPAPGTDPGSGRGGAAGPNTGEVGFEGSQAYGMPGDRHVYRDAAGNMISLLISSRRMADGTMEDVIHVVNLNNRSQPMGATYSLRSDMAALSAGVPVSIGGVSFTLKLTGTGDDHAISMSGSRGAFTNMKTPPEGPMGLSQLYAYRAARVFNYGRVVDIGGVEYYVSPETYSQLEGTPPAPQRYVGYGQFTYWPKSELDKVFAQRAGPPPRDEVNPQTFDHRSLDLSGSAFGAGVRSFRPSLAATVIRREGAQDVTMPRASAGQDDKGQWWDAVLRNGKYVLQRGVAPTPAGGQPGAGGGTVPPEGLPLENGTMYAPTGNAARLQALLRPPASTRIRFLENASAPAHQRLLIVVDNLRAQIGHPRYDGEGVATTTGYSEEIVDGRYLVTNTNVGKKWIDLNVAMARGTIEPAGIVADTKPNGSMVIRNVDVLSTILTNAGGYSAADISQIQQRVQGRAAGQPFQLSKGVGGLELTLTVGNLRGAIWPTEAPMLPFEGGDASVVPVGGGFVMNPLPGVPITHANFTQAANFLPAATSGGPLRNGTALTPLPAAGTPGGVLYKVDGAGNQDHYLSFTYSTPSGLMRMPPLLVFQGSGQNRITAPPAAVSFGNVTVTEDQQNNGRITSGFFPSADRNGGIVGVFTTTAPRTLVGVAMYWGYPSLAAAEAEARRVFAP
ncbi:MAG: hypothetical protein HYZ75_00500 [Elusimicrobia bacterium]|nr:hypothetical protein [Elusimicrobiota bacterium]